MKPENPKNALGVHHFSGNDHLQALLECTSLGGDMFSRFQSLDAWNKIAGNEQVYNFIAESGRGVKGAYLCQRPGRISDFLLQLPSDGIVRRLPAVQFSRRYLPDISSEGIPELANKQNPTIFENRNGGNPSGMPHHFTDGGFSRFLTDIVHVQFDDFSYINFTVTQDVCFWIFFIHDLQSIQYNTGL